MVSGASQRHARYFAQLAGTSDAREVTTHAQPLYGAGDDRGTALERDDIEPNMRITLMSSDSRVDRHSEDDVPKRWFGVTRSAAYYRYVSTGSAKPPSAGRQG